MKVNRRLFIITSAAVGLAAVTPARATTTSTSTLNLWGAKVDTALQMAEDYGFSFTETQALFGFLPDKAQSIAQLKQVLYQNYSRAPLVHDRVENLLTVHTWLRGGVGSDLELQRLELDRKRVILRFPVSGRKPEQRLGTLMRGGDATDIALAATFCRQTPFVPPISCSIF